MIDYHELTLSVKKEDGTQLLLEIPACMDEAEVRVTKTKYGYAATFWEYDDGPYFNYDYWASCNLSPGAGIQLIRRRRHGDVDLYNENEVGFFSYENDDYFFFGGLKDTKAQKAEVITYDDGNRMLHVDYIEAARTYGSCNPSIKIAGHSVSADRIVEVLPKEQTGWDEYELSDLICLFENQNFKSYKHFAECLKTIKLDRGDTVAIDTSIFEVEDYIQREAINKPTWAYKWLSCYEHSGCSYFEQGRSIHANDRWDTSDLVGVWYLCDERIKELEKLSDEERHKAVEQQYEHDMALISAGETALAIRTIEFDENGEEIENYTEREAVMYYTDMQPGDMAKELENISPGEPVEFTIVEKGIAKYPWEH